MSLCRRAFTLVEMVVVVAIVMVLAAIAIPEVHEAQLKAKVAELDVNVDGIGQAVIAYYTASDVDPASFYINVGVPSGGSGKTKRPWPTASQFDEMAWKPDGDVYGTYVLWYFYAGPCKTGWYTTPQGYTDVDGDAILRTVYKDMCPDEIGMDMPIQDWCSFGEPKCY
jgi:prepilin-type N-terminal cleavage/methylation domain-containing protein